MNKSIQKLFLLKYSKFNYNSFQYQTVKISRIINGNSLIYQNKYNFIISRLFKKSKNNTQQSSKIKSSKQSQQQNNQDQDQPQEQIDIFYRQQQIQTNLDYQKIKNTQSYIPQDIGKSGYNQLIYWTQSANTPQQITQLILKFNNHITSYQQINISQIQSPQHFQQFKQKVISAVSLASSIQIIQQYCIFGYKFNLKDEYYWKNIQEKVLRLPNLSHQELKKCINIVFIMGKAKQGQYIYNQIQQLISEQIHTLQIQQIAKLISSYSNMKKGKKQWIEKLFNILFKEISNFSKQVLTQIVPALQQYKGRTNQHLSKIQTRVLQLINQLSFQDICQICPLFGHSYGKQNLWSSLEKRSIYQIQRINQQKFKLKRIKNNPQKFNPISLTKMEVYNLVTGILTSYKFSTEFVDKYLIYNIQKQNFKFIKQFSPQTLATISKILYIYELQQKTGHIQKQIEMRIMQDFRNLDNAHTWALINVIKDYSITRHGSRQLFKFLQEVVKATLEDIMQDRQALEALAVIYQHSGLCSEQTLEKIKCLL